MEVLTEVGRNSSSFFPPFLSRLSEMVLSISITATISPPNPETVSFSRKNTGIQNVKNLVKTAGVPSIASAPFQSLQKGNWVKLICGASFEDVVDVRNLSLVYTLAGVDCIDCAADPAVVSAVNEGIDAAMEFVDLRRPWVMISVNDDEDLHFRKAGEVSYMREAATTSELLKRNDVDAIEIHTSGRHIDPFKELWHDLRSSAGCLKLVAISLPYNGDSTVSLMNAMHSIMEPHLKCLNLWQLDGRPMSGDIGRGATRESVSFAVRLAAAKDKPFGFFQLAGGTNAYTAEGLKREGLFQTTLATTENSKDARSMVTSHRSGAFIGGVAFGGYARKIVGRVLSSMPSQQGPCCVEDYPELLVEAVRQALDLVATMKLYHPVQNHG
ncbi:hypothetical protein LINGRAHAP2_LOCUS6199 [Linum grandiflorum]